MQEQETINLASAIKNSSYKISKENYQKLEKKKNFQKWSECLSQEEWLVKLHYLRTGYKEKKIPSEEFHLKEKKLVVQWWAKFCSPPNKT